MTPVTKVVVDGICDQKTLHELRAVPLRGLENQVKMVRHADEQVEPNVVLLDPIGQTIQEALPVILVGEKPGSKLDKAQKLGIKIVKEDELDRLIKT